MMKKRLILLSSLLVMIQAISAQSYYKHNFDLTAGGGLQATTFSPENGGDQKNKFGWVFDAMYRHQFNQHWGLGAGVGVAFYKAKSVYDDLLISNMIVDEENGRTYENKATFDNWNEDQKLIEAEVPVAVYYQTPVNANWTFIADLGAKVMIPVWNEYKTKKGTLETTGYFEDYTNIEYYELPQHGFTTYDYFCGSSDIKDVTGAGFVDAGMMYDLKRDKKLYLGVYFSYTFTNLVNKSGDHLYNGKDYIGVVTSDNVDQAHLMAAGVKVGISFGRPRKVDSLSVDSVFPLLPKTDTVVVEKVKVDSAAILLAQQQQRQLDSLRAAEEKTRHERERLEKEQAELKERLAKEQAEKDRMANEIKWLNTNLKVNFDKSQAVVEENEENDQHIAVLVEYIQSHPDKKILVTGHTCNLGKEENNVKLGLKRAEAMKQKLIEAGIPAENISTYSMGSKKPLVPNTTEENRRINRRVELAIE